MDKNDPTKSYEERVQAGLLAVYCPSCKAKANEPCKTPKGKVKSDTHSTRYEFASACNLIPVR